jgi:FkbM family methyltransferase
VSYSQTDEERYIVEACPERGRFLDLGAYHPTQFSNSRALFEKGWSGVCVEVSPEPMTALLKGYGKSPRIRLIQAAVGLSSGFRKIYATADAVSTSNEAVHSTWRDAGGYYGEFHTYQISIAKLLEEIGTDFEFINVDIEGGSADLFQRMIELGIRPKCFCVEHDGRHETLPVFAKEHGYSMPYFNGENCVFVR